MNIPSVPLRLYNIVGHVSIWFFKTPVESIDDARPNPFFSLSLHYEHNSPCPRSPIVDFKRFRLPYPQSIILITLRDDDFSFISFRIPFFIFSVSFNICLKYARQRTLWDKHLKGKAKKRKETFSALAVLLGVLWWSPAKIECLTYQAYLAWLRACVIAAYIISTHHTIAGSPSSKACNGEKIVHDPADVCIKMNIQHKDSPKPSCHCVCAVYSIESQAEQYGSGRLGNGHDWMPATCYYVTNHSKTMTMIIIITWVDEQKSQAQAKPDQSTKNHNNKSKSRWKWIGSLIMLIVFYWRRWMHADWLVWAGRKSGTEKSS